MWACVSFSIGRAGFLSFLVGRKMNFNIFSQFIQNDKLRDDDSPNGKLIDLKLPK